MNDVYEKIDEVKEANTASQLAEYLWMNYPRYAEDLMEEIRARLYLSDMDRIANSRRVLKPKHFNFRKESRWTKRL